MLSVRKHGRSRPRAHVTLGCSYVSWGHAEAEVLALFVTRSEVMNLFEFYFGCHKFCQYTRNPE